MKFLSIVILCMVCINGYGQTFYYKLTKKIVGEDVYTNTSGGQFITFVGDK